jgi:hypothetical protein
VAFTDLPSIVYPCVSLTNDQDQVTLLPKRYDRRDWPTEVQIILQDGTLDKDVSISHSKGDNWNPVRSLVGDSLLLPS